MQTIDIPENAVILVVEDSPARIDFFHHRLPDAHFVDTAWLAINFLQGKTPDVIFLDWNLWGFTSHEVAKYLSPKHTARVIVHSTHPFGASRLQQLLPNATCIPFGTFDLKIARETCAHSC